MDVTCYWVALSSADWLRERAKVKIYRKALCPHSNDEDFFIFAPRIFSLSLRRFLSEWSWVPCRSQHWGTLLRMAAGAGWWFLGPSFRSACPTLSPRPSPSTSRRSRSTSASPTARSHGSPPSCWLLCMQEVRHFLVFHRERGFDRSLSWSLEY